MTELKQIYKCPVCGNVVEVVHTGAGQLVCCGQPMQLQSKNTADASLEKHVPVISRKGDDFKVVVGVEKHPMTNEHRIEWIELITDGIVYRQELFVGDEPEAEFCVSVSERIVEARAYCNLHGLWSAKM
ncbi:MAG: desulfoferrodoxin [Candidatus Pacebacteria bacterium]|nr:desulfoferrodoxin [Candidatus Paceibacterota bacterium]